MNWMRVSVALAVFMVGFGSHADVKPKAVFYALYVIDGRAPNGDIRLDFSEGAKLDYEVLHGIFTENLKKSSAFEYRSKLLFGDQVTPDSILNALDSATAQLNRDDRFLFFYRGHAAMETDEMVFHLKRKRIPRRLIAERLRAGRNKPLAIFVLSDACAPTKDTPVVPASTIPMGLTLPDLQANLPTPLFKSLFLSSAGLIDINSAKPGSDSWSIGGRGLFTNRLIRTLQQPVKTVDINKDGTVTWEEAFKLTDRWTYQYFEKLRSENAGTGLEHAPEQHAVAFSLGSAMWSTRKTRVRNKFTYTFRIEVLSYYYNVEKKAYEWGTSDFSLKPQEAVMLGQAESNIVKWRRIRIATGEPLEEFKEVTHELYVRDEKDPGIFEIAPAHHILPKPVPEPHYYAPLPDYAHRYVLPPPPQPYYNPYPTPYYNPY